MNDCPVVAGLMVKYLLLYCRNEQLYILLLHCLVVIEHFITCHIHRQERKMVELVDRAIIQLIHLHEIYAWHVW